MEADELKNAASALNTTIIKLRSLVERAKKRGAFDTLDAATVDELLKQSGTLIRVELTEERTTTPGKACLYARMRVPTKIDNVNAIFKRFDDFKHAREVHPKNGTVFIIEFDDTRNANFILENGIGCAHISKHIHAPWYEKQCNITEKRLSVANDGVGVHELKQAVQALNTAHTKLLRKLMPPPPVPPRAPPPRPVQVTQDQIPHNSAQPSKRRKIII